MLIAQLLIKSRSRYFHYQQPRNGANHMWCQQWLPWWVHLLSFIRNVYKERFLVLVKSIEIVRNGLVKSSKTIKLLRNGTSQKTFRKENFRVFPVFPPNFPEISWIVPNFFEFFRIFLNFPQMFLNHLLMYFIHI